MADLYHRKDLEYVLGANNSISLYVRYRLCYIQVLEC